METSEHCLYDSVGFEPQSLDSVFRWSTNWGATRHSMLCHLSHPSFGELQFRSKVCAPFFFAAARGSFVSSPRAANPDFLRKKNFGNKKWKQNLDPMKLDHFRQNYFLSLKKNSCSRRKFTPHFWDCQSTHAILEYFEQLCWIMLIGILSSKATKSLCLSKYRNSFSGCVDKEKF